MMQSNAALRIAVLRASDARTACCARQRSTNCEIWVPRLSIVASSPSSDSSGAVVAKAITPTSASGKANAPRTATGPSRASATSDAPAAAPAGQASAQRSSPSSSDGSQSAPAQPSDSPIAASSPG